MCDRSDSNQELLEKLSRQLSELSSTSSTDLDEVLSPSIGTPWAQSSALSSEESPSSFSPLYTWNSAFLPASSAGSNPHLSNPSFHAQEHSPASPGSISSASHHIPRNAWGQDILSSNRDFQVIGDLSGRFSNSKPLSNSQQDYNFGNSHHFQQPKAHFHQSSTPIVGRGFAPVQPKEELLSGLASVIGNHSPTLNTCHQNFDIHNPVNSPLISGDCIDSFHNSNNSAELPTANPFFEPPPSFDPSTPPPPFSFQRQLSDTSDQTTNEPLASPNEFLEYLRFRSEPIDLDQGTNIGVSESWQTFTGDQEEVSNSEEGKHLYAEALSKWNSFDFTGIDSPEVSANLTSVQVNKQEATSESAGQDSAKPSYSDIAKTPKITQSVTSKVEQSGSDIASKAQYFSKDGKPYRSLIQRSISASKFWNKGNLDGDIDQPKVSPTSRYGLDSFEDNIHSPGSVRRNSESIWHDSNSKSKKSGSSACALDDMSVEMTGENISNEGRHIPALDKSMDKIDDKTKADVTDVQSKSSAKMSSTTSSASKSEEKLFFDPKRIFQTKNNNKSRAQSPTQKMSGKSSVIEKGEGETVLNNGKPTTPSSSSKLPTAARQHDYINNDLRDSSKVTNKTAAEGVHSSNYGKNEDFQSKQKEPLRSSSGKRSGSGRANGSYHREKRKMTEDDPNDDEYAEAPNGHRFLPANFDTEKFEEWVGVAKEKITQWGIIVLSNARSLFISTLRLIFFLSYSAFCLAFYLVVKCCSVIMTKIYARLGKTTEDSASWKSKESVRRRIGLEENITLPSTGEEAMKRLLACKGKDPYSILGVRQDSSDEDIKKYYRRQAVLVHPDKNQEPGAEEAFKVLGHAFEKIGEPSKRREYDNQALVESESELRKEFADLISKLQTKIQEAANLMPCDNCGNKHRRVPVERPFYSARFCQKCNIRHPAKEGDVWAESTMLGFYWNYYALMEGHVYDITEWMRCHQEFYKRMRANEHTVLTRIATDGNKRTKHHHTRDANLEEFINRIFPKTPGGVGGASQTNGAQPHSRAEPGWGQASHASASSSSAAAAAAAKKAGGRRKKKRH